jgi:NAD/NADP transhydrogenase beta subunit
MSTILVGWAGSSVALAGTQWDARLDTEDQLIVHFLTWFLTAYAIGAGLGFVLARRARTKAYWKVVAWTLAGAALSALFFAENASAEARAVFRESAGGELFALLMMTLPFTLPLIFGGAALKSALKKIASSIN